MGSYGSILASAGRGIAKYSATKEGGQSPATETCQRQACEMDT